MNNKKIHITFKKTDPDPGIQKLLSLSELIDT